jgi:hypothetical protein
MMQGRVVSVFPFFGVVLMDIVLQFVLTVDIRVSLYTKVVSGRSNSVSESPKGFPTFRPSLLQR